MKWERFQPVENHYETSSADRIASFAKANGMNLRGHALVWHRQTPQWVFLEGGESASCERLMERLEAHANALIGRYRGLARTWDVLNETLDPSGPSGFRDSPWFRIGGSGLFENALRVAHAVDPSAKLYYNDYGIEAGDRFENAYRYLSSLLEKGLPLHGVGIQGHWSFDEPGEETLRNALSRFASLGLEIALSEVDLSLYAFEDRETRFIEPPEDREHLQAKTYRSIFRIASDYPAVKSITTWGVTDAHTWLDSFPVKNRKNWPLLFSEDGEAKPIVPHLIETGISLAD